MKYQIRQTETGTIIEEIDTQEIASKLLGDYIEEDKLNKEYEPNFYEIVEIVDTFNELKEKVATEKSFVEVSERLYQEALLSVPPKMLNNNTWQMGEEYSNGLFYTFGIKNKRYYGCLCNDNFSINNF